MKSALRRTAKTVFKSWLCGAILGLLVGVGINLGHFAPEGSTPGEMVIGGAVAFSFLGFALGLIIAACKGAWWTIQVFRGRARVPQVGVEQRTTTASMMAGTGVAVMSTIGAALLGGLGSACYGTYWWALELSNSYPGNAPAREWIPVLMAVELPLAFLLFAALGGFAGIIIGFLGGGALGSLVAHFKPVVKK